MGDASQDALDRALAAKPDHTRFLRADAPWLSDFERASPFRLPPTYRALVTRYRFPAFVRGGVMLFGNLDGHGADDLVVASIRDSILLSVTRANGFVQIGRPASGSYDAVCFDFRQRSKSGEAELVRLDH